MNNRQKNLLARYKKSNGAYPAKAPFMIREAALMQIWKEKGFQTVSQAMADMMLRICQIQELEEEPDTLIAGYHLRESCRFPFDFRDGRIPEETKREYLKKWGIEESLEEVSAVITPLDGFSNLSAGRRHQVSDGDEKGFAWGGAWAHVWSRIYYTPGWIDNHSVRGYDKLLRHGFGGLKQQAQQELEKYPITSSERIERENFLQSVMTVCDAGICFGERLAEQSRKLGMTERAENCLAVQHGAFSFASAVQLLWLGHLISCLEDGLNANSIGRLDQMLYPYYKADIEKGVLTREQAKEWMIELAIKLYQEYDVQAITLGGTNADGSCAANELTEIILEATAEFGELRDLSLRVHPDMPDAIWEQAAKLVLRGGGIPFFFNDTCFVKALNDRGVALEDARNYAPIGCVELTIPGKANSHAVAGWFNLLKVLELTLNGGVDMINEKIIFPGCKKLDEYTSYEEFYTTYLANIRTAAAEMVYDCRRGGLKQKNFGPNTSFSMLTDDCIKRGKDISSGGAVYFWYSICLCAVPDAADSLTALRKLVFEEKKVSASELLEALSNDFEHAEPLRQMLLNDAPKYGNSDPDADGTAAGLAEYFIDLMDEWSEPDNRFYVHLFSYLININFGQHTAATPNGRKCGTPIAYSLSAHPGADRNGVSAMLGSLSKMPHDRAAGASAAIIDLHPTLFKGGSGADLFVKMMKCAFFDLHIGQLQWNIVSEAEMIRAKNDPEKYGSLQVRVAGYSQMFKLLSPELQDHLIRRTKHEC